MKNREPLIKALNKFSHGQPEAKHNENNKAYLDNGKAPNYFSSDLNFDLTFNYLENHNPRDFEGKIRVALLVGESYFLSMLPELEKHADVVVLFDIEPKILGHNKFLRSNMKDNSSTLSFAQNYITDHNLLLKNKWPVNFFELNKRTGEERHSLQPSNSHLATSMLLTNNKMLGDKHFIEGGKQYTKCRKSLLGLQFAFIKLDILNIEAVKQFKAILNSHQAVLSIINVSNILDYTGNYPLSKEHTQQRKKWMYSNTLHNALTLLSDNQPDPILLYSKLNKETRYASLTSCQASSVKEFKQQSKAYADAINTFSLASNAPESTTATRLVTSAQAMNQSNNMFKNSERLKILQMTQRGETESVINNIKAKPSSAAPSALSMSNICKSLGLIYDCCINLQYYH